MDLYSSFALRISAAAGTTHTRTIKQTLLLTCAVVFESTHLPFPSFRRGVVLVVAAFFLLLLPLDNIPVAASILRRVNDALIALEHCTHLTAIIRACIALGEIVERWMDHSGKTHGSFGLYPYPRPCVHSLTNMHISSCGR